MIPVKVRQSAKKLEDSHPDMSIHEAFIRGYQYGVENPPESVVSLDKPVAYPSPSSSFFLDDNPLPSFEDFWNQYDYKKAKPQAMKMWSRLSLSQQMEVMDALPAYIASTPDKSFRMHPATFLNPQNERWKDEIIIKHQQPNDQQQRLNRYASVIASVTGEEN